MENDSIDKQLLQLIAAKDAAALEQLYDKYERPVYSFAFRIVKDAMMAEEVVQELFLRIWNHADRIDPDQGKLTTWMFAVARNAAIDLLRKNSKKMHQPLAEEEIESFPDTGGSIEKTVEQRWIGDQVKAALGELNQDQQKVVQLIYFNGLTQQEVADKHAIPLGTVKSRVRLALKQLQHRLSGLGREVYNHE
jgi:RNA polymerase sigma factor (sigma-70 family)